MPVLIEAGGLDGPPTAEIAERHVVVSIATVPVAPWSRAKQPAHR